MCYVKLLVAGFDRLWVGDGSGVYAGGLLAVSRSAQTAVALLLPGAELCRSGDGLGEL